MSEVDIKKCSAVFSHITRSHSEEKKIRPRVLREEVPGEIRYHIEMPGVDPSSIKVEKCGNQLIINAAMKKSIQVPCLSGVSNVEGYSLRLNIPVGVEDIQAEFTKYDILVIRVRYKKETTEKIEVKFV